jgi:hypothetical protein
MLSISLPNEPIRQKHVTIYWTKHDSNCRELVLTDSYSCIMKMLSCYCFVYQIRNRYSNTCLVALENISCKAFTYGINSIIMLHVNSSLTYS